VKSQEPGDREAGVPAERVAGETGQTGARARGVVSRGAWLFVGLALLLAPLFAHGCHGDDVDHEPFLIPLRSNPEDR
jgi:hypothetical protein